MIVQLFRVGCPCGRWLLALDGGLFTSVTYPDNATAFPSLTAAHKAMAGGGWSDGRCACRGIAHGPVTLATGTHHHAGGCTGQPVPVCPKCHQGNPDDG